MKAGIFFGIHDVRVEEIDFPEMGDDDVLVQNIYCGICPSDVRAYGEEGAPLPSGSRMGHAVVSRVADFGMNAADYNIGDRVYTYAPLACGPEGNPDAIGGFAEFMCVRDVEYNRTLFPLPDTVSDQAAALIEPFAVGCHAARRGMKARSANSIYQILMNNAPYSGEIRYEEGENAVVFGAGITGIAAALCLKWFGMDKVMICDTVNSRLALAREMGFETCNFHEEDFLSAACRVFGTWGPDSMKVADIDSWVDMGISPAAADWFCKMGKPQSRFTASSGSVTLPEDQSDLIMTERTVTGAFGSEPEDVAEVIGLMAAGYYDIEHLIAEEYSLDFLPEALQKASDPTVAGIVLVNLEN